MSRCRTATADHGAYGITRTPAELALIGIAVQAAALWPVPRVPRPAIVTISRGCAVFLTFWDVDILMIVAELCLIAGALPISRENRSTSAQQFSQGDR